MTIRRSLFIASVAAVHVALAPLPARADTSPDARRAAEAARLLALPAAPETPAPAATQSADRPSRQPDPASTDETLAFTFEGVDLRVFSKLVGEFTGLRIAVPDDITGTITLVSPNVTRANAFRIYVAALESSGYSVAQDGDVYRVVALPSRRPGGIGAIVGEDGALPEAGLVTRVFHLQHVTASEMRRLLEGHLDRKDSVSAIDETNHLVVTDTAANLRRVEGIVALLDQPSSARVTEVVTLEHADATHLAQQLGAAMAETQSRADALLRRVPAAPGQPATAAPPALRAPTIVPADHANQLVLSGTQRQIDSLKDLIRQLDVDAPSGRSRLNVIFLNYLKAADAAKSITALFEKSAAAGAAAGAPARRVAVEASADGNALLVDSAPQDFEGLKAFIDALDVPPQQVHISVLIAEVQKGDGLDVGVEFTGMELPEGVGDNAVNGATRLASASPTGGLLTDLSTGAFPAGLSVGLARGAYRDNDGNLVSGFPAFLNINAIKSDSRVKVVSEQSLGAQNHQEATVKVVDDIPILESTITGSGSDRDVIQNITRREVGVKLKIVPHIAPGGNVRCELEPSIETVTSSSGDYSPTIAQRSVTTTVSVPDGRTIVIAGLTRKNFIESKRKVPLLGDIPLLGWLFRWNTREEVETNIIIFVTPKIVATDADADAVRAEWEKKTGFADMDETSAENADAAQGE